MNSIAKERYEYEAGRYVLYVDDGRVLATEQVAVLLDVRLRTLVTHGDVPTVCRELEAMRRLSIMAGLSGYDADWELLEGSPQIEDLNRLIGCPEDVAVHRESFLPPERRHGLRRAHEILARIAQRG